jgi:GT2 family glycosyltransferase
MAEDKPVHRLELHPDERVLRAPDLEAPVPHEWHRPEQLCATPLAPDGAADHRQQQTFDRGAHERMLDLRGRVCAIVVTRNRRELLRRCLAALVGQKRQLDGLLVVDNASEDGTARMVGDEFPAASLLRLTENRGGAGGFHDGMAWACAREYDWLWLLDDDTIPRDDALGALLEGAMRAPKPMPMVLTSQVRWKDERLHPMNAPVARLRWRRELAEGAAHRLLLIRYTTFVSALVRRDAVDRFGLPLEHFFIWSDDVEYTARVLRTTTGYLVPDSIVYHWTDRPHGAADPASDRFYFHARNALLILRGTSFSAVERVDFGRFVARSFRVYVRSHWRDSRRMSAFARAVWDGLTGPTR